MGLLSKVFGGSSSTTSQKQDPATVWGTQTPYLQGLYQRAQNASLGLGAGGYGAQPVQGQGYQPPIYQQQRRYGSGPLGHLQMQRQQPVQQQVAAQPGVGMPGSGMAGEDPLSALGVNLTQQGQGMLGQLGMLGQVGNPFAMGQIGQLGQGLGRLFQQSIAPTINSQFAGGGTLGGSRQALGLGQAAEGIGQSFTSGAMDILGNSANLALQANQAGLGRAGGCVQRWQHGRLRQPAGAGRRLLGGPTVLGGGGTGSGRDSTPDKGLLGRRLALVRGRG